MIENIKNTFNESIETIEASLDLVEKIDSVISIISNSFKNKNKLIIFGNGGSAADAQHIAAEFVGRFCHERESLPAIALTTDTSALSSIGNDYSFDIIFYTNRRNKQESTSILIAKLRDFFTKLDLKNVTPYIKIK